MSKKKVEIIARGVCVRDGHLLVCQSRGAANTFLPGGHVEFDEAARVALRRELREEMGQDCEVGRFLGAVEHTFIQKGTCHCEVNLIFAMTVPGIHPGAIPESCEDHISFSWLALVELADSYMEPAPLREVIPEWIGDQGSERWASTFPCE